MTSERWEHAGALVFFFSPSLIRISRPNKSYFASFDYCFAGASVSVSRSMGGRRGGGGLRKERRARLPDGCHYRVCAIWQPCLQLFTEANAAPVETARSCRSSNRSAEGFSTHGKRPRSFFKATPEGSTCLLMRFRRPTLYFCFLFFLFLTPFGFSAIFPNSILQWRGLKTNIYSNKCWEKVKQQHSWPCVCPGFQPPAKFEVFFKNGMKNRRWPRRLNTWLWVESQTWQHQSPLWHHKWLISRSVSISKDTSWEMNKVKW